MGVGSSVLNRMSDIDLIKATFTIDELNASVTSSTYLTGITPGTATASKALVVDASRNIDTIGALEASEITAGAINAGASGTAGSLDVFPATASQGKFRLECNDQTGDTTVTLEPAAMGQGTVITLPDPGAATASVALGTQGAAFTQTYSTADRTCDNLTAATLTDNSGGVADTTIAAITNAANAGSADVTPTANAIADLAAQVNALVADVLDIKQAQVAIIDDLQAFGISG